METLYQRLLSKRAQDRPDAGEALAVLQRVAGQVGQEPYRVPDVYPRTNEHRLVMWHNWANTYYRFERYEEALARNEHVLALDPNNLEGLITRANILGDMGLAAVRAGRKVEGRRQQEEALTYYAMGLSAAASDDILHRKGLHKSRGATLHEMGRYAEAEGEYVESLRLMPNDGGTWRNRANNAWDWGQSQAASGRREEARQLFQAGLGYLEQAERYDSNNPRIPALRNAFQQTLRDLPPTMPSASTEQGQSANEDSNSNGGDDRSKVHFSAFYPRVIPVRTTRTLVVYVHTPDELPAVRAKARKFQDEMGDVTPNEVTTAAVRQIPPGTYLTIVPACDGIEFNPPYVRLKWGGKEERAVFAFEADDRLTGSAVNGEIDIYLEMLNIATLRLAFLCDEAGKATPDDPQEATAALYERIFASYSHADTAVVEACRRAYVALGMDVLIDSEDLRSGELFTPALMGMIEEANVFQLFWSDRAAQSEFVRKEWMHALNLNRAPGFIRPVRWERPLTPAPAELDGLGIHFTDVCVGG
jgi:tetratricopeptide (TPR) repeat protein